MAHLEGGYEQLDKRLGDLASSIDARFARSTRDSRQMDSRFGQVELRLDGLGRRLDGFSVADDLADRGHVGHDDACNPSQH